MWGLFRTYSIVTDTNTMYSLIGIFDRYDIAMSLKQKYIDDNMTKYHDYIIKELVMNQIYDDL